MVENEPKTPAALTHMWRKLANSADVRPIRLHDAPHSCGTALHLRGVPLAVIAKWLGHADPAITARIYAHSLDEALAAAASLGQFGRSCDILVTSRPGGDAPAASGSASAQVRQQLSWCATFVVRRQGFEPRTR